VREFPWACWPTKGDEGAVRKVGVGRRKESACPTSAPSGAGALACQPNGPPESSMESVHYKKTSALLAWTLFQP
jgi:hypothetical protein